MAWIQRTRDAAQLGPYRPTGGPPVPYGAYGNDLVPIGAVHEGTPADGPASSSFGLLGALGSRGAHDLSTGPRILASLNTDAATFAVDDGARNTAFGSLYVTGPQVRDGLEDSEIYGDPIVPGMSKVDEDTQSHIQLLANTVYSHSKTKIRSTTTKLGIGAVLTALGMIEYSGGAVGWIDSESNVR